MRIVVFLLAAVGILDRGDFLFILVEIFLLALFGGSARFRLDIVRRGIDIGAAVGENVLAPPGFARSRSRNFSLISLIRGAALWLACS